MEAASWTAFECIAQVWAKPSQGARGVGFSLVAITMALRVWRGQQAAIMQHGKRQEACFSRDPEVAIYVSCYLGKKHCLADLRARLEEPI